MDGETTVVSWLPAPDECDAKLITHPTFEQINACYQYLQQGTSNTLRSLERGLQQGTHKLIDLQRGLQHHQILQALPVGIEILPPELLHIVFDYVVSSSKSPVVAARTLSHVNARWRAATIGTPAYWTTITFTPPPTPDLPAFIKTCLQRAGTRPLNITISSGHDSAIAGMRHFLMVDEVRDRIRSLNLSIPTSEVESEAFWDLPKGFPSLENLTIDCGGPASDVWAYSIKAPRLRRFQTTGTEWTGLKETLHHMTSVMIDGACMKTSAFETILKHPWLKELRLRDISCGDDPLTLPSDMLFTALRIFALEGLNPWLFQTVLHTIRPDTLKRVSFVFPPDAYPDFFKDVIQFFQRTPSIKHVHLCGSTHHLVAVFSMRGAVKEYKRIYGPLLPSLKSLKVVLRDRVMFVNERYVSTHLRKFLDRVLSPPRGRDGDVTAVPRVLDRLTANTGIIDASPAYYQARSGAVVRLNVASRRY